MYEPFEIIYMFSDSVWGVYRPDENLCVHLFFFFLSSRAIVYFIQTETKRVYEIYFFVTPSVH